MTRTTILIVEDERIVARDIQNRLTRLGYDVVGAARSGEDAVRLADQLRPDLTLMDIRLAGELDGVAAAQQIRVRFSLPVIYLTAYADDDTLARARVTEPFGYILKPFDERELHTAIEMALYKHRAERRLRASERRFAVTLSSIGDGVIATDGHGRVTFMNKAAAALTGWPPRDAAGQTLSDVFRIVNERTREPLESPAARVLRDGRAVELENHTALLARDGRELPIEDSGAPIIDDLGAVTGAVLVFHDVTEKRRAQERLRASEERFRSVFETALIGMAVADLDGRILQTNPSFERMVGCSADELYGVSLLEVTHPDDRRSTRRIMDDLLTGRREAPHYETRYVHKDGKCVWAQLVHSVLRDATGKPRFLVAMAADVTERKLLEERLRQTQKLEAIGRLAGGVAHDFNNLIAVVNGCAALLSRDLDPGDRSRQLLSEIQGAGQRAAALVRQLLVFSCKQPFVPGVIDLNELIENLAQMIKWLIGERIELILRCDPDVGLVKVDPVELERALLNLAANARDAMPGGGSLTIETRDVGAPGAASNPAPRPGRHAALAVIDTGHGMDEETRARIFEPFFTTKEAGQGTGLGLSVVHGVIHKSGGHIEVTSEPGRGATFTIYLPVVDACGSGGARE